MRLIDADDIVLDYSGLANIPPLDFRGTAEYFAKQIDAMPTIEQERKKGKWILHTYIPHHNYCSECNKDSPYNKRWDFCPNCGADMKGEQDETD